MIIFILTTIIIILIIYLIQLYNKFYKLHYRVHKNIYEHKKLIKEINEYKRAYNSSRKELQTWYNVCVNGWKNLQIKDLYSRVEVAGVSEENFTVWVTIKIFEYNVNSEEDHTRALCNAIDLVELIKKS